MGVDGSMWELDSSINPHESSYLLLDSSKARHLLCWSDKLQFEASVKWTADWFLNYKSQSARSITESQIHAFLEIPI
jgi:dTDP-D-glucose 4,6-dehydratase